MAKRKSTGTTVREMITYSPPRAAPIVVNVPRPRAMSTTGPRRNGKGKGRRRGGGGGKRDTLFHHMAAGAALGYLDKNGTNIPTVPVLGRAGTLALACHFFKSRGGGWGAWFEAGEKTFAAIASYEMIRNGSISGSPYDDIIADQT